ncbi:MAG: hypothetical protein AAF202_11095, partial [Pseudomonadota bacterium]
TEAKEVILKSCIVKNLDSAIAATRDLEAHGEESLTWKALASREFRDRQMALRELGEILLVKSGGVLDRELAARCAEIKSTKMVSIQEACLLSHKQTLQASPSELEALKTLWKLRKF